MLIKVSFNILIFILSTSGMVAASQSRDQKFEGFKSEMMPQVGKKITVVGVMNPAKLGWLIAFKEWGVYMYVVTGSDERAAMRKMNDLNRLEGHTVEVTATLRYFQPPPSTNSVEIVAIPPEHFYFDVLEAKIISLRAPPLKRSKQRRGKKSSMMSTPPANLSERNTTCI
jgi:hypothetical protein